ncbi:hypothetical protein DYB38_000475 [Aphanomyces astaci]|uniref:Uncharacterized protein n=2 Tax=Aphanomyces astaci TaxID=112090 RepID=A0A397D1M7_APHAT|nr:hypothetical protein DYB38_000475 [Aphanomyces astaci]
MDIAPDRRLTVHMSAMDADDFEKVFHGPVLVRSFVAAACSDTSIFHLLVQANFNVNAVDDEGKSPLHLACQYGHFAVVEILVKYQPVLNELTESGMTALHQAVYNGVELAVVEALVEAKSDIENICSDVYSADPIINDAVAQSDLNVVEYLLEQGVNIEVTNNEGYTPLIVATQFKRHDVMALLLEKNAKLEAADKNGCTALMESILKRDHIGTDLLVLHGASLHSRNKNGFSAISLAMYHDIELGKRLYSMHQKKLQSPAKTPSTTTTVMAMQKQLSSDVGRSLRVGDLIYLHVENGMVLGCDGFLHTDLHLTFPTHEWEDYIFCIHPKMSYDYVDLSLGVHPYFETTDAFSEEERYDAMEKRRNDEKLTLALQTKDLVREYSTIQLFHVKSQQYLRVNPMASTTHANVELDHLPSCYSWFQFHADKPSSDLGIMTNSPVTLASASVSSAAQAVRKSKPVTLLANHSSTTKVLLGLYTSHDPLVLRPFVWKNGEYAISGTGTRQLPLPRSYSLNFKPQVSKVNSVFHLEMSSKSSAGGVLYQLRHVSSRFLLAMQCPCAKRDHVTASLVNPESLDTWIAHLKVAYHNNAVRSDLAHHDDDHREYAFHFSHTCPKCSRVWCLGTTQNKVHTGTGGSSLMYCTLSQMVWNQSGEWLVGVPISTDFTKKVHHVCAWREAFLTFSHTALCFLDDTTTTENIIPQSIHAVLVASQQIHSLMETPEVDEVVSFLQQICADVEILEAMFLATSIFRSMASIEGVDELMVTFFRAMRVLVVGNDSSEIYLQEQFGDRLGQIKILTGLDMEFATKYVDARIIMTNMIAKNSGAVSHLLENINASHIVPGNWTITAQFFIALSLSERPDSLIAKKLYDHEMNVSETWVSKWETCAIHTRLDGDSICVRWCDSHEDGRAIPGMLHRSATIAAFKSQVKIEPTHVTVPLELLVDESSKPTLPPLVDKWIALYMHQLKLVSALCEKNVNVRRFFQPKFPKHVLVAGIRRESLPFAIRTLYVELLHYLYVPPTGMLDNIQLSNLFLDLNIHGANPLSSHMPALYILIDATIHAVVVNNVSYFVFLRKLLSFVDSLLSVGYCGTNPAYYKQLFEALYVTGMKCDAVVKFDSNGDRSTLDPLNLSCNTTYGVANVRSTTAPGDPPVEFSHGLVQYLSNLLGHNDTLVAQEAFVTLSEILPRASFAWLRAVKPMCELVKPDDHNDSLRQIIHEAQAVFDLDAHTFHSHVQRLHTKILDEGRKKKSKASTDPLQVSIHRVKKWKRNVASNNPTLLRMLRIAQIPERTIAYLEAALARGVFVVPSNDDLALELEYYKTVVFKSTAIDNNATKGNSHFRMAKEEAVKDRATLAHHLLSLLHQFTPHLSEEFSLRLLVLVVPLVNDNFALVKDVSSLVYSMLCQPNAVVDSRYADVFKALLKHVHYNESAGQCVLHMLRESQSDEWKNQASYQLFYSEFDLKTLLVAYPKQVFVLDILCLVADGSTNERIYGHLECKSLLSLEWIVQLITHAQATPSHKRVGLALIKTLYLDSDLETGWVSTHLDTLRPAFAFCRQALSMVGSHMDVVVDGVVPFLKAWVAMVTVQSKNPVVVEFHHHLEGDMKAMISHLDQLTSQHPFMCAHAKYPLSHVVETLSQLTMCTTMALIGNTRNDMAMAYAVELKKAPPQRICYHPFVRGARALLVNHAAKLMVQDPNQLSSALVIGAFQRLQATSIPDATLLDLAIVGKHLIQVDQQASQWDQDLISLILAEQDGLSSSGNKKPNHFNKWAKVTPQLHRLKAALAFRPAKAARDKTFRGKSYQSLDVQSFVDPVFVADHVNKDSSVDTFAHWKKSFEPLDLQTLMQCLVRLITRSSSSSLLGLRVFVQALTSKREAAEDRTEYDEKALLQARVEWKALLSTAVKSDVTSLVFWCIKESMEEVSNPVKSRLALNLISELLVDGFKEAQDALYAGYVGLDDHFRSYLFGFLMSHITGQSHDASIVSLTLFQLLCEGHHTNWQNIMRSGKFNRSVLDTVINLMARICKQSDNVFALKDVQVMSKVLAFLSEACQGPCLENQQFIAESVVPRLCTDISLGKPQCENGQYPLHLAKLKHNVNVLLLSMVEGRDDTLVHLHYVELIRPQDMCRVLTVNRKKIKSIELLRLAYSLLSKATSHTVDNLFYFSKGWHDAQNEHVAFFAKQTINVEVVRGDTEIQVYFPRPRESRFLSPREQKRLMDIMEFGEDNALAAFTSPESRNIAEELRTRHILAQNATYEWMTENQTFIRQAMFVVCFYINFVMVLGLAIDPDDSEPVVHIYSYWTLSGLGGVFCILCSSLWLYNIATEMSFSYARQKLKPVKLRRMTLQDMTSEVWSAIAESCYAIGMFRSCGWVAVYAAITMVYGMDDSLTYITAGVSLAYVLYIVLLAIRKVSGIFHFAYITDDKVRNRQVAISNVLFWFNAVVDTLIKDNVVVFTLYTLCAFMGLSSDVSKRAYLKAVTSNLVPLGVTMAFGTIVIYLFSLIGFFRFQELMTNDDGPQCSSMMQCYLTYIHYGLLSGGGIGDYMSSTLAHPLDYSDQVSFFERVVYDLGFYIVILLLLINLIMGIIIDSFTSLREASEKKQEIENSICLVCNDTKDDIEYRGILLGLSNSFKKHKEEEHNLWNYLFFIMYLESKPATDLNGTESFVRQKLLAKEMSWIPKKKGNSVRAAAEAY